MTQLEWESQSVQIRNRMNRLRHKLDHEVEHIVSQAQSLFDWREHLRRNPLAIAGVAAAAGFLLMPGRKVTPAVKLDSKSLDALSEQTKRMLQPPPEQTKQPFLKGAAVALSGLILRQVVAAASARAEQYLREMAKNSRAAMAQNAEEVRGPAAVKRPMPGAN